MGRPARPTGAGHRHARQAALGILSGLCRLFGVTLGVAPAAAQPVAVRAAATHAAATHAAATPFGVRRADPGGRVEAVLLSVAVGTQARGSVFGLVAVDPAPGDAPGRATGTPFVLVAARTTLGLAGVHAVRTGARVLARLHPGNVPLELDAAAGRVRRGRRWTPAGPDDLRVADGEVYVALPLLARLLGITAAYHADDALVELRDPGVLPVTRQARHAAAWNAAHRATPAAPPVPPALLRGGRPRGLALDYDVTRWGAALPGGGHAAAAVTTVGVGVSAATGPGVATVRLSGTRGRTVLGGAARALELGWRWDRGSDADGLHVRSVRIGDAPTGGVRPYGVRGLVLTNAPPVRDPGGKLEVVRGALPAGWAVEAYQAGALVAVDTTGTAAGSTLGDSLEPDAPAAHRRYRLAVPLHAGPNAVDLVAVGPYGELRTTSRVVHRAPMAVRPGAWEYVLAAGACDPRDASSPAEVRDCRGRAGADVRYGVSSRLAVRGGVDGAWRADAGAAWRPYAAVSAAPWDAAVVEAEAAPGAFAHVAARVQPSAAWSLGVDRVRTRVAWGGASGGRGMLSVPGAAGAASVVTQSLVQAFAAPGALRGASLDGHLARATWTGERWTEARLGAALPLPAGRGDWRPYVRREAAGAGPAHTFAGASGALPAGGPLARALAGVAGQAGRPAAAALARAVGPAWLTYHAEVTGDGTPRRAGLGVARPAAGRWRVDAAAEWARGGRGVRGTVALSAQPGGLRASTRAMGDAGGTAATQSVAGSAVWDPVARRVAWSAEPARERGSVVGTVFLDLDGDGRRAAGEPGVPGARLAVASRVVAADARGRFRALGLPAGAVVHLALDSASLQSPAWAPAGPAVAVRVPAGGLAAVDVPVVLTSVVEGRVTAPGGRVPPGLRVMLRRLATGETLTADVFGDGTFYVGAAPPGAYAVLAAAEGAGWTFAPSEVTVRAVVAPADLALEAPGGVVRGVVVAARAPADVAADVAVAVLAAAETGAPGDAPGTASATSASAMPAPAADSVGATALALARSVASADTAPAGAAVAPRRAPASRVARGVTSRPLARLALGPNPRPPTPPAAPRLMFAPRPSPAPPAPPALPALPLPPLPGLRRRRGRRPSGRRPRAGHTLVELVMVLTVGLILTMAVTPRINRSAYDADAGARVVRGALQTAQRLAVAQQADVVVGFDLANHRLRMLEDLNGNGRYDAGAGLRERITYRPLDPGARFAAPPSRPGGGTAPTTALANVTDLVDALPSVTFHRDGAASENGEAYLKAVRGGNTEWRAVVVARATGRVEWWARAGGGAWARRGP